VTNPTGQTWKERVDLAMKKLEAHWNVVGEEKQALELEALIVQFVDGADFF
jgi:hypothetical protein